MKNEKSYSESVKSLSMSEMKNDAVVQEMLIDMIIQEAVLTTKKNLLAKQIDDALDMKNKPLFLKLSSEMNVLLKQFEINIHDQKSLP
ncbi:IDEAL domain-containing protein [[Brevibacterium] frigoritolerans]|uniref:IDEAL domain-containing protein n=1 Tax=Peribacillus frigoritolerans TaxID=450367 RepID=A0A941FM66_9BACI|nr:IDEAL domain-containing protein [Peribacillus frigoritolerans]